MNVMVVEILRLKDCIAVSAEICTDLTFKALSKIVADDILFYIYIYFFFRENKTTFHVNRLLSRHETSSLIFSELNNKKGRKKEMSSATVVISAFLRRLMLLNPYCSLDGIDDNIYPINFND